LSEQVKRPFAGFPFLARIVGAARLNSATYDEVKSDQTATLQSLLAVVMAALAVGTGLKVGLGYLPLFVVSWGVAWGTWVFLIYVLGVTVFNRPAAEGDWGQLVRTAGFAQAPVVFQVLGIFSIAQFGLVAAVTVWQFATMTMAVRETFNYDSSWRAAGPVLVGFIPYVVIGLLLSP
jgi:hypothetical protein